VKIGGLNVDFERWVDICVPGTGEKASSFAVPKIRAETDVGASSGGEGVG